MAQGCRNLATQQVGSYPGHSGCCANAVGKAARDPKRTAARNLCCVAWDALRNVMLTAISEGFAHCDPVFRRHLSNRNRAGWHNQRCVSIYKHKNMAPIFQEPLRHNLQLREVRLFAPREWSARIDLYTDESGRRINRKHHLGDFGFPFLRQAVVLQPDTMEISALVRPVIIDPAALSNCTMRAPSSFGLTERSNPVNFAAHGASAAGSLNMCHHRS